MNLRLKSFHLFPNTIRVTLTFASDTEASIPVEIKHANIHSATVAEIEQLAIVEAKKLIGD
ncbi:hypothetical protein [Burkholderia aenigmatica]|uniref:Uncharacterized protein n=1 Tax=Burkholderia aenigmatica TaxID=2015348 RepID=A0A228IK01_9BURK|nr:hypothetical protein [Burkholderia aenigmatica]OXI42459.1 hypothetical protein CFB84_24945 [Burkholderia aenigmatica]